MQKRAKCFWIVRRVNWNRKPHSTKGGFVGFFFFLLKTLVPKDHPGMQLPQLG